MLRVQILKGTEESVLTELLNILNNSSSYSVATWNAAFTLPFVTTRMAANNLSMSILPPSLNHLGMRPWNLKQTISVSEYVQGIGWFKSTLLEHAYNLGIDHNIIEGEDVYKAFLAGKTQELDDSEVDYIKTLVNVYYSFTGEDKIFASEVTVKVLDEDVEVEEKPLLQKLMSLGNFTTEIQEEIKELIGKKKLSKNDKNNIESLLLSVYQQKGDKKAVKQKKEEEITNFVKEL